MTIELALNAEQEEAFRRIRERMAITDNLEVIRRALAWYDLSSELYFEGKEIFFRHPDGEYELVKLI